MNTQSYIIRLLDKNDLLQAAEICADAMNDNPIHIRVFGADSLVRKRRLQGFLSGMLTMFIVKVIYTELLLITA